MMKIQFRNRFQSRNHNTSSSRAMEWCRPPANPAHARSKASLGYYATLKAICSLGLRLRQLHPPIMSLAGGHGGSHFGDLRCYDSLQTASEVKSDVGFEIINLHYPDKPCSWPQRSTLVKSSINALKLVCLLLGISATL